MRAIAPASRVSPPMAAVLPKPVVAPSIEPVVGAPKRSADVNRAALPSTPAGSVAPLTARPHPTRAPIPSAARATNEPTARAAPIQPDAPQKPANESELAEMHDIGNAERLIATDPARALAIADDMRTRFPHGYFREERSYVEVMSLIALRRFDDARAKADDFLRTYPDGPYSRRIRHALERGVH
jgi:TolA-binding protein